MLSAELGTARQRVSLTNAAAVVAECRAAGVHADAVAADVTRTEGVEQLFDAAAAMPSPLTGVVANAGGAPSRQRLEDMSDEPSPLIRKHMNRAFRAIEKRLDGAA